VGNSASLLRVRARAGLAKLVLLLLAANIVLAFCSAANRSLFLSLSSPPLTGHVATSSSDGILFFCL